ncbi:MAG: alpha/beta fold hydrolase [Bacteroidetes bacterium]|nr:MAG: alpha/beta fold hydrolase [Bacteroidota bacterium]
MMKIKQLITRAVGLGLNLLSFFTPRRAGYLAYLVFVSPPAPLVRPKEKAFLATAQRQDATVAGKPVVLYHWAMEDERRPWVLLSYGWGYNAGRWRHFVPGLLVAGYRLTAYDPTGHGQAPKGRLHFADNMNILIALMETYGQPAAFIGHSFGGACGVQSLAFLDRKLHPKRMVIMASFSHAEQSVFQVFKRMLGLNERMYTAFCDTIMAQAGLRRTKDTNIGAFSAQLGHIPVLLVHDPADPVTPYEQVYGYYHNWPGSELYTPTQAGHHLGTQEVTNRVLAFVQL